VIDPGLEIAVNEEASPPPAFGVNATSTLADPYGVLVTFEAVPIVADNGITPSCDHPADV